MMDLINQTISEIWPVLLINLIIYISFRLFYLKNCNKKLKLFHEISYIILIIYVFLLASILSFGELNLISGSNIIPFKEIFRYELTSPLFYRNVIGNVLLYMPLGFFMGYFLKFKKTSLVIFLTALISLSGELIQRYVGRTFDIDDVILNLIGGLIGYTIYRLFQKLYKKLPKVFQKDGLYNVLCIIILLVVVLYVLNIVGVINVL